MEKAIDLYLEFWIFTIPFSIYLLYKLIPELLDLVLNTNKISKLLEKSDNLNLEKLKQNHEVNSKKQNSLNESNLLELKRQVDYLNLTENQKNYRYEYGEIGQIKKAKRLADIFKV